jgi:hypothetical protein
MELCKVPLAAHEGGGSGLGARGWWGRVATDYRLLTTDYSSDEPIPPPGNRLDEPRLVKLIAQRAANLPDVGFQHTYTDGYARPQGSKEFIFVNELVRPFQ